MSQLTLAQVLDAVQTWPVEDQKQLEQWLTQREMPAQPVKHSPVKHTFDTNDSLPPLDVIPSFKTKRVPPLFPDKDMSGEKQWLAENSAQYAGQWVALEGNRLVKAGRSAKEVQIGRAHV